MNTERFKSFHLVASIVTGTHRVLFVDNRSLDAVDCEVVEWDVDSRVYHTVGEGKIDAVRVSEDEEGLVLDSEERREVRVLAERKKEADFEQYVYGGPVYATEAEVKFAGEYNGRGKLPKYKSSARVRVNDCLLRGEGSSASDEWKWETLDEGSAAFVKTDDSLARSFGVDVCMVVGYETPVENLEVAQSML